ncbi:MAG: hypothetical protein ACOX7F_02950 [Eubacteriales bacterium]|jgi:hypothetical protein
MFQQMVGIIIALCCILAILSAILPQKHSQPLSAMMGMLVLLAVLSPFAGGLMPALQWEVSSVETQEAEQLGRMEETMEDLTRTSVEGQVAELVRQRTGLEPQVAVTLEWSDGMVRVVDITVVVGKNDAALEEELRQLYGADVVVVC